MSRIIIVESCGVPCPERRMDAEGSPWCSIAFKQLRGDDAKPFPSFCPLPEPPAPVAKVRLSRKVVDGMGEAAVMAARMGGVPGEPIKTILEAWGIEVTP